MSGSKGSEEIKNQNNHGFFSEKIIINLKIKNKKLPSLAIDAFVMSDDLNKNIQAHMFWGCVLFAQTVYLFKNNSRYQQP